jgi:uncharacterized membrane protein
LIALYKLSKAYNNKDIWLHALTGFIICMVAAVGLTIVVFDYMIPILITLYPYAFSPYGPPLGFHTGSLVLFIMFSMLGNAFGVSGYKFFEDAYSELAESSRIYNFDDAAEQYGFGVSLFMLSLLLCGLSFIALAWGAGFFGVLFGLPFLFLAIVGAILVIVGHIYALLGYRELRSKLRFCR